MAEREIQASCEDGWQDGGAHVLKARERCILHKSKKSLSKQAFVQIKCQQQQQQQKERTVVLGKGKAETQEQQKGNKLSSCSFSRQNQKVASFFNQKEN